MAHAMARHDTFGAVNRNDFADNQMRTRSLVAKFSRPVMAAFKMYGWLSDAAWANQRRWQRVKSDFRDLADGAREPFRACLDLSCHSLGHRIDDVFLRFEHVMDRVLQSIVTFVSNETKQRWRDRNDNELAKRRCIEYPLAAKGRNESDGTRDHCPHQKFVPIGLGEARKIELGIVRMKHGLGIS